MSKKKMGGEVEESAGGRHLTETKMEPQRRPSPALSAASSSAASSVSSSRAVRVLDAFHHADPATVVTALAVDESGGRVFIGERWRKRARSGIRFLGCRGCCATTACNAPGWLCPPPREAGHQRL